MRVGILIGLGVLCGCGLGWATSWARYGREAAGDVFTVTVQRSVPEMEPPPEGEPQPKVGIENDEFFFGDIEQGTDNEHLFRVTNLGEAPLKLRSAGTTCSKCTVSELAKTVLLPGDSEDIKVSYHAYGMGAFRQTATLLTNDGLYPRLHLTVSGKVVTSLRTVPADLVFSRLSVDEPATADLQLLNYTQQPLEVTGHEFSDADIADHFRVEIEMLDAEELHKQEAHSGVRVRVTVLPGLPVGPLRQKLRLLTNQASMPTVEVPIQGLVDSDIGIIGAGWNSERGLLDMGPVQSKAGAERQLFLLLRGRHRQNVRFAIVNRQPDWLQARFGEPQEVNGGALVKVPLTIIVPPGSPAANHLGSAQGKMGQLSIDTTHPTASRLNVFVQFSVEN